MDQTAGYGNFLYPAFAQEIENVAAAKTKRLKKLRSIIQNNTAMMIILVIVLVLLAALLFKGHKIQNKIASNKIELDKVNVQIEEENQRTQKIQELEEYMKSQEYIEKVAKDKLGLIKDGEIIFKEQK